MRLTSRKTLKIEETSLGQTELISQELTKSQIEIYLKVGRIKAAAGGEILGLLGFPQPI
jgi:hypothetical protein